MVDCRKVFYCPKPRVIIGTWVQDARPSNVVKVSMRAFAINRSILNQDRDGIFFSKVKETRPL